MMWWNMVGKSLSKYLFGKSYLAIIYGYVAPLPVMVTGIVTIFILLYCLSLIFAYIKSYVRKCFVKYYEND